METPEELAKDLIKKFGNRAILVCDVAKKHSDATRIPFWNNTIDQIKIEKLKRINITHTPHNNRYEN